MKITASKLKAKTFLRCTYMTGTDTIDPELRAVTVSRDDLKSALMQLVEVMELPYLGLDFEEPEEFEAQDLLDAIMYNNENQGGYDYIFKLEINNDVVLNSTVGQVDY